MTVTSSIAGILIPPGHNMILYSLAAGGGISVSALFIAGIVPGVMMCLCLARGGLCRRGPARLSGGALAGLAPPGLVASSMRCRGC